VDDLIDGFVRMMATPDDITGPVNLGNPVEMPMVELAQRVLKLTGAKSSLVFRPLPVDDPMQRCPDISRATAILDWEPKVQLDEGLGKTIAYFDRLLSDGMAV
jgi:UDP-glucuronate decarboxylase